ncbi:helix-turn-helix domain-containing protein, partial [Escherichia coli]|uniref:helix-turn-helix domain-containing protein n=1 Tax=Escherichia coli TaxID=562 RepID=UPI003FD0FADD
ATNAPEQKIIDALTGQPPGKIAYHNGNMWRKAADGYGYEYAPMHVQAAPEASANKKIYTRWKPAGYAVEALAAADISDPGTCWLLVKMASVAQDNQQFGGICYTGSIETICALVGQSDRTVRNELTTLINAGLLTVVKQGKAKVCGRTYQLTFWTGGNDGSDRKPQ